MHLSTETTPSLLLAVFSAHLFHPLAYLTVFLSSVTTLFQMLCKPLARNSWLSHTARVSRWIVIAFDKQMLWEPSLSINIGSIHSGYETVLLWFQQHNAVRAGIFTMSYYTERPDMIWVICHKLTATWTPKLNFQLADSSGQTDGATKKYPTTGYSSGESYKASNTTLYLLAVQTRLMCCGGRITKVWSKYAPLHWSLWQYSHIF